MILCHHWHYMSVPLLSHPGWIWVNPPNHTFSHHWWSFSSVRENTHAKLCLFLPSMIWTIPGFIKLQQPDSILYAIVKTLNVFHRLIVSLCLMELLGGDIPSPSSFLGNIWWTESLLVPWTETQVRMSQNWFFFLSKLVTVMKYATYLLIEFMKCT